MIRQFFQQAQATISKLNTIDSGFVLQNLLIILSASHGKNKMKIITLQTGEIKYINDRAAQNLFILPGNYVPVQYQLSFLLIVCNIWPLLPSLVKYQEISLT